MITFACGNKTSPPISIPPQPPPPLTKPTTPGQRKARQRAILTEELGGDDREQESGYTGRLQRRFAMMETMEGSGLGERQDEKSLQKPPAQYSNCTKFEKGLNEYFLPKREKNTQRNWEGE